MKRHIAIIFLSFAFTCMLSCSCGSETDSEGYPYYSGTEYPDEINTDETTITGNVFYCDPVSGNINNDGSENAPWPAFQEVIDNKK